MIQTDILKAAGVTDQDIQRLTTAWEAFQAAKKQTIRQMPHIVCTGIYNAGKSTLLNALAEKEIFPTGDIPTTKKVTQAEFGGAMYIDTPGLNAMEEDDRETQAAYETADFILFVANAQDGGISAAEAEWLQKLKARYSSLQQRLDLVLTHCTQVDPEQLPAIREKVCEDFRKALEFTPEQLLCVDSITYQDGKSQNEPLLTESSGVPKLRDDLAKRIVGAEETLREAQTAELAARREDVTKQLEHCADYCRRILQKLSAQKQSTEITSLFTRTEKMLADKISGSAGFPGWMRYMSESEDFEGRSNGSVKRDAKDHVRSFAQNVLDEAKDTTESMLDDAETIYGNAGLDSIYYKKCDEINRILEELQAALMKQGIRLGTYQDIQIRPKLDRFSSELARYRNNSSYLSASEYLNMYENRIDTYKDELGYEEHGFFGSVKYVPKYRAYTGRANSEVYEKIKKTFEANMYRAMDWVDKCYWQPFLKELHSEASKRLDGMQKAAEASALQTEQEVEKPYQSALDHLDTLRKEALR